MQRRLETVSYALLLRKKAMSYYLDMQKFAEKRLSM